MKTRFKFAKTVPEALVQVYTMKQFAISFRN